MNNGRINALEYGFIGDGVTKNDAVMKKYIENDYTTPIFFPRAHMFLQKASISTTSAISSLKQMQN